jgi:hypothetical protein
MTRCKMIHKMNKKFIRNLGLVLITFFIVQACKKTETKKEESCIGGSGGNLTLVVYPQHHGKELKSSVNYRDTVYIKYNATNFPGKSPSSYDKVIAGDSGENHVHISGLKCGSYFIYATAFDTSAQERVYGGIPFTTSQKEGEVSVMVPVKE